LSANKEIIYQDTASHEIYLKDEQKKFLNDMLMKYIERLKALYLKTYKEKNSEEDAIHVIMMEKGKITEEQTDKYNRLIEKFSTIENSALL
jgi:uncharacterized protein YqkB